MKNYIESYESLLSGSDQQKLTGLLNVGAKAVTSDTTVAAEGKLEETIRQLMSELGKNKMKFKLRLQEEGGQTNSVNYNLNLQEIIGDLKTLFAESNRLDALLVNHQQLNKAVLNNLAKDIKRLENRIDTLNLLADNVQGYGTASRENFSDASKMENDRTTYASLFLDRSGYALGVDLDCQIDPIEGTLKLGSSESYDRIHTVSGATVATIEILEQIGEGFSNADPNYNISRAIDGRMDTFWGEVLLSDGVLRVPLDGITGGALCKFKITFPTPVTVSQFSFKPYCEFPIEICYIAYTRNDSNSIETGNYCVPYDAAHPILTDNGITIDFPRVVAKSLIVLIRQSSAAKNHYTVSVDQKQNKEMWSKIAAAERKLTLDTVWVDEDPATVNPSLTQDMIDQYDVRWQQFIDAQKKINDMRALIAAGGAIAGAAVGGAIGFGIIVAADAIAIFSHLVATAPKRVQVEKYEYVYGAYEIGVRGQEYNPIGIYVSKPHKVNGNVQTVVLEASEWHPKFVSQVGGTLNKKVYNDSGAVVEFPEPLRRTAIEYYISPGKENQWIPILPLTQTYIDTEFLIFPDPSVPKAKLRWAALEDPTHTVRVYKDEAPLRPEAWDWADSVHQTIEIAPAFWDPESYYTVDYYPDESSVSAHQIDFTPGSGYIGNPKTAREYFNAPGSKVVDKNCAMSLEYYPYVDRDKIASRDVNGNITFTTENYKYNPVRVTLNPSENPDVNPKVHMINGPKVITTEILPVRNPSTDIPNKPLARCLNMTDYLSGDLPVLNPYVPTPHPATNPIPTFEYYHNGKKVIMTETFRHDGPAENYSISNGNAIIKVEYEYLVSGVRVRIIMRRTSRMDASVTPKVDWYAVKFKVLV